MAVRTGHEAMEGESTMEQLAPEATEAAQALGAVGVILSLIHI